MNEIDNFRSEVAANIEGLGQDEEIQKLSTSWIRNAGKHKWSYNFSWMGRPAIQFPNDEWAIQEIIWEVQPDLIIETGIAHGGSLILSSSISPIVFPNLSLR